MTDVRLKLAPPWVTYVNEIKALFEGDKDVRVTYDNDKVEINIYVEEFRKARAIEEILPISKQFGKVELKIYVIPANVDENGDLSKCTYGQIFDAAFKGNPAYSFSVDIDSVFTNVLTYVVFTNKVVQFFNDNLNDVYGNMSTLYQEIASDVFETKGNVFFCTDIKKDLVSERQWP